jgi:outer membrane lipoprotein LolB
MHCFPRGRNRYLWPLVVWLSACATHPPVIDAGKVEDLQSARDRLSQLNDWQLRGRIALNLDDEAWSASLQWTQTKEDYLLRVIAPLGRGSFELRGDDQGVMMRLAQNQVLRATDPETLLREQFGWIVPVSGLRYWIRGIPDPGARVTHLSTDKHGRITRLEQSGWQVTYTQYASRGEYTLPGRIALENGNLKLRLLIRHWIL